MLKILLAIEATSGGTARHVRNLARGLGNAGHDVHVIYSSYRLDPEFELAVAEMDCVTSAVIDIHRMPHPSDISAVVRFRRYLRDQGPFDVVHGHSMKGALSCLATPRRQAARIFSPLAWRSMDPDLSGAARLGVMAAERLAARFADVIIALSPEEFAQARRLHVPVHKLRNVPIGLDEVKTEVRPKVRQQLGLKNGDVAVGFVGRLERQKAPHRVVEAFAKVADHAPATKLVIIGDGALRDHVSTRVRELQLDQRVLLPGALDGRQVLPAFDVFAMTSLYEGMPYALLEAGVAGLPLVATQVGGAGLMISPGENGYIVTNWDEDEFAGRLSELVRNRSVRNSMAKASREICQKFSVERMVSETVSVYEGALGAG